MTASLKEKLARPGSSKILALDGGGIRGILTIEVLDQIESTLRTAFSKGADFVLADYFDFVSGTRTGTIIATCIAGSKRGQSLNSEL